MTQYDTISLHNCDNEIKHSRLVSITSSMQVIIPFDGDSALLAYVNPSNTAEFKNILRANSIGYTDLKIKVSEDEVSKYTTNVAKKRMVKVGDIVKVSGYGNAPFTITEVGSTMATAKIELFNFTHTVTEPHSKFSQHKTYEDIQFNPYNISINTSNEYCLIDCKLLNTTFNPSSVKQKIYLLIRIKSLMHNGGKVLLHNPSHEFEEIAKIFGLAISHGTVESKTAIVPRDSELSLHTSTLYDVSSMHLQRIPMTLEEKFISFLSMKKYNFSPEQIYQHFQDTSRFKKQRMEFFKVLTNPEHGTITDFDLDIPNLRLWLSDHSLGQLEENLSLYLKRLSE